MRAFVASSADRWSFVVLISVKRSIEGETGRNRQSFLYFVGPKSCGSEKASCTSFRLAAVEPTIPSQSRGMRASKIDICARHKARKADRQRESKPTVVVLREDMDAK